MSLSVPSVKERATHPIFRPYGRSLAMVLASGGRVRLLTPVQTGTKNFGKNREIFLTNLENFIHFGLEEPDKILGSFLVSESPFESFSKFVKTTPGLQSWCFILKQTEKKSQQHFSQFLYFHQFNLTHDHGRR